MQFGYLATARELRDPGIGADAVETEETAWPCREQKRAAIWFPAMKMGARRSYETLVNYFEYTASYSRRHGSVLWSN
jgi:hypothetical protein